MSFRSFLPQNCFLISSGRKWCSHTLVYSVTINLSRCYCLFTAKSQRFLTLVSKGKEKMKCEFYSLVAVKRTSAVRHAAIFNTTTTRRTRTVLRHDWLLSTRASLSCFRACGCDECGKGLFVNGLDVRWILFRFLYQTFPDLQNNKIVNFRLVNICLPRPLCKLYKIAIF